jgi:hypothetical protein
MATLSQIIMVIVQIGINNNNNNKIICTTIIIIDGGKVKIRRIIIIAIHPEIKDGTGLVIIIGIIKDNLLSHLLGFL